MSSKSEHKPAGSKVSRPEAPAGAASASGTPRKLRPARKLFQPQAGPLDSGVGPLLAVRRPRRHTRPLAVIATCLTLAGASVAIAQNAAPPAGDPAGAPNRAELEEAVERSAVMLAQQMLLTNDVAATNAANTNASLTATGSASPNVMMAVTSAAAASRSDSERSRRRDGGDRSSWRDRDRSDSSRSYGSSQSGSSSNNPSAQASGQGASKNVESFSAFALIGDRNIFNPNRSARRKSDESRPKPTVVDSFGLVGIMAYEKGTFVFFDGSKSEFKKVLKLSDKIAGYTVAEINSASVKLSKDDKTVDMPVGSQMRREEQGDWVFSAQPQSFAAAPAPGASAAPSSSSSTSTGATPSGPPGSADEVLKRLMQRREQE